MTDKYIQTTLGSIAKGSSGLVDGPFGSNLPASEYREDGIPIIRGSNLTLGTSRFRTEKFVFVSNETAELLSRSLCRPLDIIFTKKGTLGQTGIVPEDGPYSLYLLSSNQMKLTVDPELADPLFVYYVVSSSDSTDKIIRDSEATGVPKTNLAYLRDFPITLPPLAEQRAIAWILGALDDKIELNGRMNGTLEDIAQTLFKHWFVDFDPVRAKAVGRDPSFPKPIADLFPVRLVDSEIGEIPEGWKSGVIDDLTEILGGSTPRTNQPSYWEGGTHYWATPKDLSTLTSPVLLETERRITDAGLTQIGSRLLPQGTVLLSSRAPIGYLAIAEVPVAINQGFIAMKPRKGVPSLFLLLWAQSAHQEIVSHANGSTFLEISKASFKRLPIVIPPPALLSAFGHLINPIYKRIILNQYQTLILSTLRDLLLPRLISAEIRLSKGP
jgi:type I restriction enzyme, S subunit